METSLERGSSLELRENIMSAEAPRTLEKIRRKEKQEKALRVDIINGNNPCESASIGTASAATDAVKDFYLGTDRVSMCSNLESRISKHDSQGKKRKRKRSALKDSDKHCLLYAGNSINNKASLAEPLPVQPFNDARLSNREFTGERNWGPDALQSNDGYDTLYMNDIEHSGKDGTDLRLKMTVDIYDSRQKSNRSPNLVKTAVIQKQDGDIKAEGVASGTQNPKDQKRKRKKTRRNQFCDLSGNGLEASGKDDPKKNAIDLSNGEIVGNNKAESVFKVRGAEIMEANSVIAGRNAALSRINGGLTIQEDADVVVGHDALDKGTAKCTTRRKRKRDKKKKASFAMGTQAIKETERVQTLMEHSDNQCAKEDAGRNKVMDLDAEAIRHQEVDTMANQNLPDIQNGSDSIRRKKKRSKTKRSFSSIANESEAIKEINMMQPSSKHLVSQSAGNDAGDNIPEILSQEDTGMKEVPISASNDVLGFENTGLVVEHDDALEKDTAKKRKRKRDRKGKTSGRVEKNAAEETEKAWTSVEHSDERCVKEDVVNNVYAVVNLDLEATRHKELDTRVNQNLLEASNANGSIGRNRKRNKKKMPVENKSEAVKESDTIQTSFRYLVSRSANCSDSITEISGQDDNGRKEVLISSTNSLSGVANAGRPMEHNDAPQRNTAATIIRRNRRRDKKKKASDAIEENVVKESEKEQVLSKLSDEWHAKNDVNNVDEVVDSEQKAMRHQEVDVGVDKRGTQMEEFSSTLSKLVGTKMSAISCAADEEGELKIERHFAGGACHDHPKKKLLVLDLNGILADVVAGFHCVDPPDARVSGKSVFKRPFCYNFVRFCLERFDVGIWSSRKKKNLQPIVNILLKGCRANLLFCWDASQCAKTRFKTLEKRGKPIVFKELSRLWNHLGICVSCGRKKYDESNTLLLDDSPYKALRNPPYTAIFPYSYQYTDPGDSSLGPEGDLRLYLEKLADADNVQKFVRENPFGQPAISEAHPSWNFYSKILEKRKRTRKKRKNQKKKTTGE